MSDTILVADNEAAIVRFVEVNLRLEGYQVVTAQDGRQALDLASTTNPALILLDVALPGVDGYEVCRRLRADHRTCTIPIIILTARSLTVDKVVGLTAGADDYVIKPFDPVELIVRVRTTISRASEYRGTSPLTGLPGNHRIDREAALRHASGAPLAVAYVDLNDFKSYNDRYGFLRGDELITMTGDLLREALRRHCGPQAFLGHIGGDDFVVMCHPDEVEKVCEFVTEEFDRRAPAYYDAEDLVRGGIAVENRRGDLWRYPVVTICLGVATNERRSYTDHREMIEVATEMKSYLKRRRTGSCYAIDERADQRV